jgi:hypothetical protein
MVKDPWYNFRFTIDQALGRYRVGLWIEEEDGSYELLQTRYLKPEFAMVWIVSLHDVLTNRIDIEGNLSANEITRSAEDHRRVIESWENALSKLQLTGPDYVPRRSSSSGATGH